MSDTRAVTLFDVARHAEVGKSTVSNVLAGSGRFSEATRVRVLAAAAELGYEPNRAARRLRGGRTGVVGVYVPGIPSTSEFYMRFVFGVMQYFSHRGGDTVILSGRERGVFPSMDGVIVADPHEDDPMAGALLGSAVPSVSFERAGGVGAGTPDVTVYCDHERALRVVLDQVCEAGSERPALMVPPETGDWARQLGSAYRRWCRDHGVVPEIVTVDWVPGPGQVDRVTDELLTRAPGVDALFCAPVDTAPATLAALARHGRRIGEDFLLATGTESAAAALGHPAITSLDLDPLAAGVRCAELLDSRQAGDAPVEVEHPVLIHLRASTKGRGTVTVHADEAPHPPARLPR